MDTKIMKRDIGLLLILLLFPFGLAAKPETAHAAKTDVPIHTASDTSFLKNAVNIDGPQDVPFPDDIWEQDPADTYGLPVLSNTSLHLLAGGNSYELELENALNASYTVASGDISCIALENETAQSATIRPLKEGEAILNVSAIGLNGATTQLTCEITVSKLSLSKGLVELYLNDAEPEATVTVTGVDFDAVYYDEPLLEAINGSPYCSIRAGNPDVADVYSYDGTLYITGRGKGTTNIRVELYGVQVSVKVKVYCYSLNKYTINTYKGGAKKTLLVKGAGGKKVTWSVGNKKVASVTKKGVVIPKNVGATKITAKVNGRKLMCIVSVSSKTAWRALKSAKAISNNKNVHYSQEKRMSQNYYDCSSFVYRCYQPYGIHFGYTNTAWAPVASVEGRWCADKKHLIATQAVDILSCKLVPGDTIFYSFNENNGQYLNIDHVAIFSGYHYDAMSGYYGTILEASNSSDAVVERTYHMSADSIKLIGRPSKQ